MKTPVSLLCTAAVAAVLLVAGCSTPDSRISKNQAAFNSYPADVQTKIKAGQVEVGFTMDMVKLALGDPDRKYTRQTEKGTSEVWAYRDKRPTIGFGFGIGGGGGSTHVGTGVGVTTGGDSRDDRLRVIFAESKVAAIEKMGK